MWFFFFQAEDGIRDLVRSRGLGDVYKRQVLEYIQRIKIEAAKRQFENNRKNVNDIMYEVGYTCLLYTSDAADERSSVDLGGRRIIKKKNIDKYWESRVYKKTQ